MKKYLIFVFTLSSVAFLTDGAYTNSSYSKENDKRKLIYLQIVSTNGYYAPLELFPYDLNTADDFPEGLGALTKLGKLQQYEFGKYLRERYRGFISSDPDEIDAFSSAEDRSTISTLSLLASLNAPTKEWEFFPGFPWQPPTLSYMDQNDFFFRYNDSCLNQLLDSYHRFVDYHSKKDKVMYSFWEVHSGYDLLTWKEVALLYDTIEKERRAGLKVSSWAMKYLPHMERITNAAYAQHYNSTLCLKIKVGKLLDFIVVRMRVKVLEDDPSPDIKLSVYMTHDWNMAALLTAIGHSSGVRPPPCTTLNFEMYQDGDEYSVRLVLFNSTTPELGKQPAHVLTLKGCSEFCPLSKFVEFFNFLFPVYYYRNCGKTVFWVDSGSENRPSNETLLDQLEAIARDNITERPSYIYSGNYVGM